MARLLDNGFLEFPTDAGDVYGSGLTLGSGALGIFLLGRATGNQSLEAAGSDLSRSLAASAAAVWCLKLASGRTRPNGWRYSFPSGHTAAAFSVVPAIRKHFGLKAVVPACALALSAGLGRMEDRKHYLSDVIFGAALGLAMGEAVVGSSSTWPRGSPRRRNPLVSAMLPAHLRSRAEPAYRLSSHATRSRSPVVL